MNEKTLSHHGILGMKWGIRRYQDYGEGGYNPKKKGKIKGSEKERRKIENSLNARSVQTAKYKAAKMRAIDKDIKARFDDDIRYGDEYCKRLVKDATSKGYTVTSKDFMYNVDSGREYYNKQLSGTMSIILPVASQTMAGQVSAMQRLPGHKIKTKRYTVNI